MKGQELLSKHAGSRFQSNAGSQNITGCQTFAHCICYPPLAIPCREPVSFLDARFAWGGNGGGTSGELACGWRRVKPTLNPANKPARVGGERVITPFRTRNRRAELSTGKRNTLTWPYPRQMAGESLGQCCLNSGVLGEGCQESVWELNRGLGQFPPAQEQPEACLSSSSSGLTRVAQQRRATELCTLNSHLARCILDQGSSRNQG